MAEVIIALDMPSAAGALALLDRIPGVRWAKVGSILMTSEGPALIRELRDRGLRVFLDLKWHDIPNTVAGAVAAARDAGIAMATVHTLGGIEMMRAAAAAAGEHLTVVGVTVLTSHDAAGLAGVLGRPVVAVADEVIRLARTAREAGLAGVVCSPHEVARVRAELGESALIVAPGIRRRADAAGDQRRTATAAEAARDGATHVVVGRPITGAADPAGAFADLSAEAGWTAE